MTELAVTARHEAAHALLTLQCGREASIVLTPHDPASHGVCRSADYRPPNEELLIALAGPVAEALATADEDIAPVDCAVGVGIALAEFTAKGGCAADPSHDYALAVAAAEGGGLDANTAIEALAGFLARPHVARALDRLAAAVCASPDLSLTAAEVRRLARCDRWKRTNSPRAVFARACG